MEKKTNYGKIIAITLAVITAFASMAYIVYRLFVKNMSKCYECSDAGDDFIADDKDDIEVIEEEDDNTPTVK